MHLTHVTLPVADPAAVARWYAEILGLRVVPVGESWQVSVGASLLTLRSGAAPGAHHLAFDVAPDGFAAARSWLGDRVRLLERDGLDEFEGPPGWSSRSVYVEGPETSVLELIARRDLPVPAPAGDPRLLRVSEVGVAVPDVRTAARQLRTERDVPTYAGEPDETFAAVGDVHGLLVLVAEGRRWFPTQDRYAEAAGIEVTATGGRPGSTPVGAGRLTLG